MVSADFIEKEDEEGMSPGLISILLQSYDDIFSNFDARPYAHKSISQDFLAELRRSSTDKNDNVELRLMHPKQARKLDTEVIIKKRLREHFKRHHELVHKDINATRGKGLFMALIGAIFLIGAAYLSFLNIQTFWVHMIVIILEPAGWFTAWTGLDEIYYTVQQKKQELNFYEKMTRANIVFSSY